MAKENLLFSIYGARLSKSNKRVNISVVNGSDDERTWGTISVELNGEGKTQATIKNGYAYIKVPMLKELEPKKPAKGKIKDKESKDDLPF